MSFLTADSIASLGIPHGFFTREDGVSAGVFASRNVKESIGDSTENTAENRRRCVQEIMHEDSPLVYAKLCHGTNIYEVTNPNHTSKDVEDYDAIISTVPHVVVGLSTADCVPILLADTEKRAVAIIHAGWRGLEAGVIGQTIAKLTESHGILPQKLVCAIGPAIHQKSYEVGAEVADRFESKFTLLENDSRYLDLLAITVEQLKQSGIEHIEMQSPDTAVDKRFYSYRAEDGNTGRQLSAISLR